jgi:hypothetical protein
MMTAFVSTFLLFGQFELSPTDLYRRANAYYEHGKYAEAIAAYEQVSTGITNAKVFYNLGNSYFKRGMMGKAILNFRRAHFLSPRDGDVMYNLEFVRNYRVDKISAAGSPFVDLLSGVFHYTSMYESQILTAVLFVIAILSMALLIVYRLRIFFYLTIISGFTCLFFFVGWQVWGAELTGGHAVIIVPEVSAASGPGVDYKEIIVLHDGAEVKVRETRGDYCLIQLPGGVGGWVPRGALEYIF